jgi:hypothetical protein
LCENNPHRGFFKRKEEKMNKEKFPVKQILKLIRGEIKELKEPLVIEIFYAGKNEMRVVIDKVDLLRNENVLWRLPRRWRHGITYSPSPWYQGDKLYKGKKIIPPFKCVDMWGDCLTKGLCLACREVGQPD